MTHYPEDPRRAEALAMDMAEISDRLGLQDLKPAGHELVGPCPQCGGTDRFGINKRKNVFNCRRCGGTGGNIDLVMFVQGMDFKAALEWLCGPSEGISDAERQRRIEKAEENRRRNVARAQKERETAIRLGREIWMAGKPAEGTAVREYLARRGISVELLPRLPLCLRFHPDLAYTVKIDGEWREAHRGPAMLAAVQRPDDRFSAVHRTWIDLDQPKGKARVFHPVSGAELPAKKVLGSKKGGAIRLTAVASTMIMAEGIETTATALVAASEPDCAYWAGVDLGNMSGQRKSGPGHKYSGIPDMGDAEAWVPPRGVNRLIFIQDGDSDPRLTRAKLEAGLRRAMVLRPGLRGQIVHAGQGVDLNDVLMGANDAPIS
ncbi:CHC2 zinc finger domain-containing protein [Cereibacter sp. SYSU M97828]|nr:CHC2 zinc finger domain-containing protein [Cereibacter flavus]